MTTTRSQGIAKAILTRSPNKSRQSSVADATSTAIKCQLRKNRAVKRAATTAVTLAAAATSSSAVMPVGVAALTTSPYFSKPPSKTSPSTMKESTTLNAARKASSSSPTTTPPKKKKVRTQSPSPKTAKKKQKTPVKRTNSFEPMWFGNFPDLDTQEAATITGASSPIDVHTLILGTHPSIRSLSEEQYYGHPMNAFWWIAGDCLGFRRSTGVSPSSGEPYKFTSTLRYGVEKVIPYEEQIRTMAQHGFAMWDVISSCKREGSLDSAIEHETPNDIEGFCKNHPSIRRIVLANGSTGSKYFVKHFKSWWESGQLRPADNKESQTAFNRKAFAKATNNYKNATITCISAVSVSPAAASYSYEQKRDFWESYVYQPGLQDFKELQSK